MLAFIRDRSNMRGNSSPFSFPMPLLLSSFTLPPFTPLILDKFHIQIYEYSPLTHNNIEYIKWPCATPGNQAWAGSLDYSSGLALSTFFSFLKTKKTNEDIISQIPVYFYLSYNSKENKKESDLDSWPDQDEIVSKEIDYSVLTKRVVTIGLFLNFPFLPCQSKSLSIQPYSLYFRQNFCQILLEITNFQIYILKEEVKSPEPKNSKKSRLVFKKFLKKVEGKVYVKKESEEILWKRWKRKKA